MAVSAPDAHAAALAAFRSALGGQVLRLERNEGSWRAELGAAWIQGGLWRFVSADGVMRASEEDGHQFGLPRPVDAETEANTAMAGRPVTEASISPLTGDLILHFGDRRLEFLVTSAGYESWEATFTDGGLDYLIVCNGGRLSVHSNFAGERPTIIRGGPWKVA